MAMTYQPNFSQGKTDSLQITMRHWVSDLRQQVTIQNDPHPLLIRTDV